MNSAMRSCSAWHELQDARVWDIGAIPKSNILQVASANASARAVWQSQSRNRPLSGQNSRCVVSTTWVSHNFVPQNAMLIGYARISTVDQNPALQRDALTAAGCDRVFTDEGVSGSVPARRGLDGALAALGPGDTLVVWKLDRLGRSLSHLVTLIAELGARQVNFRSLSDPIDSESSSGRLVMHIMGALAEFERSLIVERTQAGIQAAKKRGVRLGRRPSLAAAQVARARALVERGESPRAIARTMRVGKSTLYRALKDADS